MRTPTRVLHEGREVIPAPGKNHPGMRGQCPVLVQGGKMSLPTSRLMLEELIIHRALGRIQVGLALWRGIISTKLRAAQNQQ